MGRSCDSNQANQNLSLRPSFAMNLRKGTISLWQCRLEDMISGVLVAMDPASWRKLAWKIEGDIHKETSWWEQEPTQHLVFGMLYLYSYNEPISFSSCLTSLKLNSLGNKRIWLTWVLTHLFDFHLASSHPLRAHHILWMSEDWRCLQKHRMLGSNEYFVSSFSIDINFLRA